MQIQLPKFTVIIPAKDEAERLPRLFQDIQKQTLQPVRVIVADAGSTDATRTIAQQFGAEVVVGGMPGVGRNAGAAVANTEVLIFLDADIRLIDTEFFARTLNEFVRRDLDIATTDVVSIDAGNNIDKLGHGFYNRYVRFWGSRHPHTPGFCIIVKKSVHEAIGGFDPTVLFLEDHDYGYRAVRKHGAKFAVLNGAKVGLTMRRFYRDGRLFVVLQYTLAEIYYFFFGPIRHNLFRYKFTKYH